MDDLYDDDEPRSADQQRDVLARIAAYREVCASVRRSGGGSLLFGGVMLFLWYVAFFGKRDQYSLMSVMFLSLGILELFVGLMNRFRPSAEGVLLDGIALIGFGGVSLFRQYLVWNQGFNPSWLMIGLGAFWVYSGLQHVKNYAILRKVFAQRPSRAHLQWFDELLNEIRASDPESDLQALDLPTKPRLRAKLLGDTAIFLSGNDETFFVDRHDVQLKRTMSAESDQLPTGHLTIQGYDFGSFKLHPENWRNYSAWKLEGGEPFETTIRV